jgi:hypothetical protein
MRETEAAGAPAPCRRTDGQKDLDPRLLGMGRRHRRERGGEVRVCERRGVPHRTAGDAGAWARVPRRRTEGSFGCTIWGWGRHHGRKR